MYSFFRKLVKAISGRGTGITRLPFVYSAYAFVVNRFHPKQITVEGLKLYLDKNDSMRLSVFDEPYPDEHAFYRSLVQPGWCVVDVGANIGYFTLCFSKYAGESGKVIAFEPLPEVFELLKKSVGENNLRNVALANLALSDSDGQITLSISDTNMGDSSIVSKRGAREITVEKTTLDGYLGKIGFAGKIDLIKMDIQGAEPLALEGMAGTLRKFHPQIMSEFDPGMLGRERALAYLKKLQSLGYGLCLLDGGTIGVPELFVDTLLKEGRFVNIHCK